MIRRGTTPTVKAKINNIDIVQIENCYITLEQNHYEITKEATYVGDHYEITLTQEETLAFKTGKVRMQVKIKTIDETVLATNIVEKPISEILNEEIL